MGNPFGLIKLLLNANERNRREGGRYYGTYFCFDSGRGFRTSFCLTRGGSCWAESMVSVMAFLTMVSMARTKRTAVRDGTGSTVIEALQRLPPLLHGGRQARTPTLMGDYPTVSRLHFTRLRVRTVDTIRSAARIKLYSVRIVLTVRLNLTDGLWSRTLINGLEPSKSRSS